MPRRNMNEDDPLEDFARRSITFHGFTKAVHVAGTGPAVIVMAEMPGISPHLARFSRWVREAGFTVYMPSLFGRDGAVSDVNEAALVFQRACVSAEFRALAANKSSPAILWLRSLARLAHEECGGPGVGAIGMCFTGNFALTMMLEPSMLAPVLCQPAMPLENPAGLDITPDELVAVGQRLERDDLTAMAYRFAGPDACELNNDQQHRQRGELDPLGSAHLQPLGKDECEEQKDHEPDGEDHRGPVVGPGGREHVRHAATASSAVPELSPGGEAASACSSGPRIQSHACV